jgi:hypothetical protein
MLLFLFVQDESEILKEQNTVAMMNTKLRSLAQRDRDRRHTRHSDTPTRRARKRRSDKASPQFVSSAISITSLMQDIPFKIYDNFLVVSGLHKIFVLSRQPTG